MTSLKGECPASRRKWSSIVTPEVFIFLSAISSQVFFVSSLAPTIIVIYLAPFYNTEGY